MTNHNHKIDLPSCEFAEQLIAVLYDEASESEKSEFDKHLIECLSCTAEQAAFGSVRNQIIEWRRNDFELLEPKPIMVPTTLPARSNNWTLRVKRWRAHFVAQTSFSQSAAAFAGLVICLGLLAFFGYLLANRNSKIEIVNNPINKQISSPLDSSASLRPTALPTATPLSNVAGNNRQPIFPKPATVKPPSEKSKSNSSSLTTVPGAANLRRGKITEQQSATPVAAPPANDLIIEAADDFEDDSLRLTDLLDDSTFPTSSK